MVVNTSAMQVANVLAVLLGIQFFTACATVPTPASTAPAPRDKSGDLDASVSSNYEEGIRQLSRAILAEAGKLQKQNLAVVDLTDLQGNVTALGRFIAEELSASLVMAGGVQVVDRNQLKKLFQEHSLSMLGLSDPDEVIRIGNIVGADALVTGSITDLEENVRVTAKVLATNTARVIAAAKTTFPKTGAVAKLMKEGIETPSSPKAGSVSPADKAATGPVAHKTEIKNYAFEIKECKKKGGGITCALLVTNMEGDSDLTIFGTGSSPQSRLFDTRGHVYEARVRVGNSHEENNVTVKLVKGIPTALTLNFEKVSADVSGIALLEVGCIERGGSRVTAQFRNVPLGQ